MTQLWCSGESQLKDYRAFLPVSLRKPFYCVIALYHLTDCCKTVVCCQQVSLRDRGGSSQMPLWWSELAYPQDHCEGGQFWQHMLPKAWSTRVTTGECDSLNQVLFSFILRYLVFCIHILPPVISKPLSSPRGGDRHFQQSFFTFSSTRRCCGKKITVVGHYEESHLSCPSPLPSIFALSHPWAFPKQRPRIAWDPASWAVSALPNGVFKHRNQDWD